MRVLVADDHALFRDGVISLLEAAGFEVVEQVGDGQAAVEAAKRLHPDLVLLDINMPVLGGLEALRQIKAGLPRTRVVMLTVSDDDADLMEAFRAGAQGYLLKNLSAEGFLASLRGLEHGEMALTRQAATRLITGMVKRPPRALDSSEPLTPRENELLTLVAQGLSNKAVAQRLSVSENTVKYHIKKIMQKLNVQNRTEAVSHAVRLGLIKPPAA